MPGLSCRILARTHGGNAVLFWRCLTPRIFFAASALPVLLYFLLLTFFIPESARFLLGVGMCQCVSGVNSNLGRVVDALTVLQEVARANGKEWKEVWNTAISTQTQERMPEREKSYQLSAMMLSVKVRYAHRIHFLFVETMRGI